MFSLLIFCSKTKKGKVREIVTTSSSTPAFLAVHKLETTPYFCIGLHSICHRRGDGWVGGDDSLIHLFTQLLNHAFTQAFKPFTQQFTHPFTQQFTHPLTQQFTHPFTHPLTQQFTQPFTQQFTSSLKNSPIHPLTQPGVQPGD